MTPPHLLFWSLPVILFLAGVFNTPTFANRPDLKIGRGPGNQKGDNIYNKSGNNQTVTRNSRNRRAASYFVDAEDDAPSGLPLFPFSGPRSSRFFRIQYFNRADGENISAQMAMPFGVQWTSCGPPDCAMGTSGGLRLIKVDVKPKRLAQRKKRKRGTSGW